MRKNLFAVLAAVVILAPGTAAPDPQGSGSGRLENPLTTPPPDDDRLLTPSQQNRQGLKGAAEVPFRDVNLIRSKIPAILLEAMTDPYTRPIPANCMGIGAVVRDLDEALGPDLDTPVTPDNPGLLARGKVAANGAMKDALAGAAEGVIPFRGWVRKLSGAEQHDHLVNAAITAGGVRRAYMKGLGEAKGCGLPAAPRHLAHMPTPVEDDSGPRRPLYPIH